MPNTTDASNTGNNSPTSESSRGYVEVQAVPVTDAPAGSQAEARPEGGAMPVDSVEDVEAQTSAPVQPVDASQAAFEAMKAERDNYLDLLRRERADFDNFRKRTDRDMKQLKRHSLASFLKDFFDPLDDLDRVLVESGKGHSYDALATGVRIMEEKFWRILAKSGVKKIDARGKVFDPNQHEALTVIPSRDVPPNTVIEVCENGYKLDDFVLRPAKVVVSREAE